jgi:putative ABC transport system permease protein
MLVLRHTFGLSDEQLEHQLIYRLSFQQFVGRSYEEEIPYFTTLWNFKEALVKNKLMDRIFSSIVSQIKLNGLLVGSYPALYLAGFQPAAVLRGEVKGSWGELWARKGLVVFQFALSVVLIVSVLVIYRQIEFVQPQNLGYNKEHLIYFPLEGRVREKRETFLQQVRQVPGVLQATTMGRNLLGRNDNTSGLN